MFYKRNDVYYNLDQIVKVQDVDNCFRDSDYFFLENQKIETSFFGLIEVAVYEPGYYSKDWLDGTLHPITEEMALHSNKEIVVWFADQTTKEFKFETEQDKLDFLKMLLEYNKSIIKETNG